MGFNYLGRFAASSEFAPWTYAPEWPELSGGADADMPLFHLLEINALTIDSDAGPSLRAEWTWATAHLSRADVSELSELWRNAIEGLVRHATQPGSGGHSPSDFPLTALTQDQVEKLEKSHPQLTDILPLTPLQEGLLFHSLYDTSAGHTYLVQLRIELEGKLVPARLRRATERVLTRHASLNVAIAHDGLDRPVQVVGPARLIWREEDLSRLPVTAQAKRRHELLSADRTEPFDLSAGPLLRFTLQRLSQKQHTLILTINHILIDGWSLPIFLEEILTCYEGKEAILPQVYPQTEFLGWLAKQDRTEAQLAWREYLADFAGGASLTSGATAPAGMPRLMDIDIPDALIDLSQTLARERGLTLNTLIQGLWAMMLGEILHRDDVVFGVTVSGRPTEIDGIERMLGLFINTLPLRIRLRPDDTPSTLFAGIQESQARMLPYQYLGLSEIMQATGLRDLFDTLLVFENYPLNRSALSAEGRGLRVRDLEVQDATHYPLCLIALPSPRLTLKLAYDPTRIDMATAEDISSSFKRFFASAVESPDTPLYCLNRLIARDRQAVLEVFNETAHPVPEPHCLYLFERLAQRAPDSEAVISESETISYRTLNESANRLAHHLIASGVGPECVVGVALERSPELVATLVGIFKAGAAYLLLDPKYPEARLSHMAEDAGVVAILTTVALRQRMPQNLGPVFALDDNEFRTALYRAPSHNPSDAERLSPLRRDHAAYVIYTSGSTGAPKGVVIPHRALVNKLTTLNRFLGVVATTRYAATSSLSFDPLVEQVFCP